MFALGTRLGAPAGVEVDAGAAADSGRDGGCDAASGLNDRKRRSPWLPGQPLSPHYQHTYLKPMSPTFLPFSASIPTFSPLPPGWLLNCSDAGSGVGSSLGIVPRMSFASSSPLVFASTEIRAVPAGDLIRRSCCQLAKQLLELTIVASCKFL